MNCKNHEEVPLSPAWIKDPDRAFFAESQDLIVRGFSYLQIQSRGRSPPKWRSKNLIITLNASLDSGISAL